MDTLFLSINVGFHLRVPFPCCMPKMNRIFEHFFEFFFGCHESLGLVPGHRHFLSRIPFVWDRTIESDVRLRYNRLVF